MHDFGYAFGTPPTLERRLKSGQADVMTSIPGHNNDYVTGQGMVP